VFLRNKTTRSHNGHHNLNNDTRENLEIFNQENIFYTYIKCNILVFSKIEFELKRKVEETLGR
jgi:hypothetical protein